MKRNPYYAGPVTDHFDGTRFFNPDEPDSDKSLKQILRWQKERPGKWPRRMPVTPAKPDTRHEGLRVTMVGHASVLIQAGGLNILTDPVWAGRVGPLGVLGPRRVAAPGIRFDDLPPINVVLLSHNHYDHMDLATLRRLDRRDAPEVITPLGNDTILARHVTRGRVQTGDWGDAFDLGELQVHIVPANHWSSRGVRDRRMALWGGFVMRTPVGTIYFAGDTGYGSGEVFRQIRADHGAPDLAMLPIGAYAPRWFMAPQHCDPAEAVQMALDLEAGMAVGMHWATFRLTHEPHGEPATLLEDHVRKTGRDPNWFRAARPGDVFEATVPR